MTQKVPKEIAEESLIPIIVGVTGHRDNFSDEDLLVIKNVFTDLHDKYKNTPIVVLSPLAEGADRLIATAALSLRSEMPISVICPLPLPLKEYKNDFDENSKKEFDLLLKEVGDGWFDIPLVEGNTKENIVKGYTDETTGEKEGPRNKQYEAVGIYVAQYSHILLALWDGVDKPESIGGTSQIVKMRHDGDLRPRRILHEMDSGPIYHFPVTKNEKGEPAIGMRREVFPGMSLDPAKSTSKDQEIFNQKSETLRRVLDGVNSFNIDVLSIKDREEDIANSEISLIPNEYRDKLGSVERKLLRHFAVADRLAIDFQKKFVFALKGLFYVALIALAFFEVYAHLINHPAILLGYPVIFGFGLIWFLYAKDRGYQKKYLDYRALAEALRVQFFWVVSGIKNEVIDHYLLQQETELDWIKIAIQSYNTPLTRKDLLEREALQNRSSNETVEISKSIIRPRWVTEQKDYFRKKASDFQTNLKSNHAFTRNLLIAGTTIAILLFIGELLIHPQPCSECIGPHHWFTEARHIAIVAIAMAVVTAASIHGYTEKTAISAIAKRYAGMSNIFTTADAELDRRLKVGDVSDIQKLFYRLGKEALTENGEWLITRRDRKLELPA